MQGSTKAPGCNKAAWQSANSEVVLLQVEKVCLETNRTSQAVYTSITTTIKYGLTFHLTYHRTKHMSKTPLLLRDKLSVKLLVAAGMDTSLVKPPRRWKTNCFDQIAGSIHFQLE